MGRGLEVRRKSENLPAVSSALNLVVFSRSGTQVWQCGLKPVYLARPVQPELSEPPFLSWERRFFCWRRNSAAIVHHSQQTTQVCEKGVISKSRFLRCGRNDGEADAVHRCGRNDGGGAKPVKRRVRRSGARGRLKKRISNVEYRILNFEVGRFFWEVRAGVWFGEER